MANSKIPSVQITDTFNTQRGRFNQLVDSVGDVSTLTTTATDITNAIKEHDAELGTISAGAMGTTASTVSTAIAELDGRLDSINTVELLSPRMSLSDGTAVNTIAGKLEVSDSADFADNLSVQGNLAVGGNTTMSGTLTVDGEVTFKAGANSNINLGDANTDNVVFNADVNSNIIPNTDNAYDLGSSSQEWRHVYVNGTVNADNLAADSATITGDLDVQGLTTLDSTAIEGNLILSTDKFTVDYTGNTSIAGTLNVDGVTTTDSINAVGLVAITGDLTVSGDTTLSNTITVQDSAYITGNLDLGSNLTVAGDTTFANTITVQDSAYITGNLDIGGDVTSTGTAFTISAETGTDDEVSLGDTITFEAGEGITTTVSNSNIKIEGELASDTNKGVASFSTDNFSVTSGVVTIKDNGVALGTETTGNYMSGISGTANEITVSHTPGEGSSATISLPDDVTIGQDLGVTRNLNVTGTFSVGGVTTFTGGTRFATSHAVMLDGVAVNNVNRAGIAIDRPSTDSAVVQWNEFGDYWEAGTTDGVNRLALQNDSATFSNIYQTGTGATRLPAGTTLQRPTARQGQVRYNTDLSAFEGYSGSNWGSLGGLIDVDQDTYIVTERVESSDSDTLQFYAAGTKVATLNTTSFDIEEPINVNDTTQASGTTSGALIVDGGVGIAKNAHVGGTLDVTGIARLNKTTDATSSTSGGSLTVDGGAAIAKKLYIGDNLYVPDTKVIGTTKIDNDLVGGGYLRLHADSGDNGAAGMQFVAGSVSAAAAPFSFITYGGQFNVTGASLLQLGNASQNLTIDPDGSGNKTLLYAKQAPDGENDTHIAFDNTDRIDVKAGIFNITSDSAYFSGDVNISGDLIISGTTTTINTETLTLQDNIIVLNSNSAATPSEDAGLEVERGNSNNVVLKWDEGDDRWQFTNDGSTYYNIPISSEYNNFTYSLPAATSTVRGGIELYSNTQAGTAESVTTTSNRTYGIQVNSAGQAVVNVPWTDNDTIYSLPLATSTVRGGIELYSNTDQSTAAESVTTTAGRTYGLQLNSLNQGVVNVPWVNTTYSAGKDIDLNSGAFDIEATLNHVTAITVANDANFGITTQGNGDITIASADAFDLKAGSGVLTLQHETSGSNASRPMSFIVYNNDTVPDDDQDIGNITFRMENSASQLTDYVKVRAETLDVTDGTEDGQFIVETLRNGASFLQIELGGEDTTDDFIRSGGSLRLEHGDGSNSVGGARNAVYIQSSETNGGNDPAELTLFNKNTALSDNNEVGRINFTGENTQAGTFPADETTYASITAKALDVTDGTEDGGIEIGVLSYNRPFMTNVFAASTGVTTIKNPLNTAEIQVGRYGNDAANKDIYISTDHDFEVFANDDMLFDHGLGHQLKITEDGSVSGLELKYHESLQYSEIRSDQALVIASEVGSTYKTVIESGSEYGGLRIGNPNYRQHTGNNQSGLDLSDRFISFGVYDTNAGSGVFTPARTRSNSVIDGAFAMNFKHGTGTVIEWYADKDPFNATADFQNICNWSVDGDFTAAGQIAAYSDARLKDNVETVDNALDKVSSMRGVTFTRNDKVDKEKKYVGVIAQEMQEIVPEVVNHDEEKDVYTVDYDGLVGVLIEAVKDLKKEVDELKGKCKCH